MPFAATWLNLEIIILSEVNQKEKDIKYLTLEITKSDKDKYYIITYMWNLKK